MITPEIIKQIDKVCACLFELLPVQLSYVLSEINIYDEKIEQMRDYIEVKGRFDGKHVWHIASYIVNTSQSKKFYKLYDSLNLKSV